MRSILSLLILLFSNISWLAAQELLEPSPAGPAALLPGLESHHHPIATKNAEAQKFFDQGLLLNFGFNHDEAVRSFRRAIELDPEAAMAYWGVAWALGPRYAYVSLTPGSDIFLDVDLERESRYAKIPSGSHLTEVLALICSDFPP